MFEIHPGNWPVAGGASDPRDQFHVTALHEARVATERNPRLIVASSARPTFVDRIRHALAGGSATTVQPCDCSA